MGVTSYKLGATKKSLLSEKADLEAEEKRLQEKVKLVEEVERMEQETDKVIGVIVNLNKRRFDYVHILDDLCEAIPPYTWLEKFEEKGNNVKISGITFSNVMVGNFMVNLNNSPSFKNVELVQIKKAKIGDNPVVKFEITATMIRHSEVREKTTQSSAGSASKKGSK